MEKVGFFTAADTSEPCQALDEQVLAKLMFGAPEGLEITVAQPDVGIGQGIRRATAMNRMDIPMYWRALIRRPDGKKGDPVVSLLAPRGQSAADAGPKLTAAGVVTENMVAGADSFDCTFAAGTPTATIVGFAVGALQALGMVTQQGEYQWTVRNKGAIPR